ncbi:MAG: hypothetical protein ABIP39_00835 [Polyangiaceae bacterium]
MTQAAQTPAQAEAARPPRPSGERRTPKFLTQRRVLTAIGVPLVVVGLIGLAHLPFARSLLAAAGGCPAAFARATPAELEKSRGEAMQGLRTDRAAAGHGALRFALGSSTKSEILGWADGAGASCSEEMKGAAVRCRGVASDAVHAPAPGLLYSDVFFRFDTKGILVAIDAMHDGATADQAIHYFETASRKLEADYGPATPSPMPTAESLAEPFTRAAFEYRFRDLAVDLTATNLGDKGIVVREQYRAIPNP